MRSLIKKYRYDPDLVDSILNDRDYYFIFFSGICYERKNKLYLPKLHKNGDLTMLCPLHNEKTPSFRVNAQNNLFKCFGCGLSGNFITLLAKYHNVYYVTAIKLAIKIKDPKLIVANSSLQTYLDLQPPLALPISYDSNSVLTDLDGDPDDGLPF